jgi:hypothetical protein
MLRASVIAGQRPAGHDNRDLHQMKKPPGEGGFGGGVFG